MSSESKNRKGDGRETETATLRVEGRLTNESGARLFDDLETALSNGVAEIRINLEGMHGFDTLGGAWLIRTVREGRAAGATVTIEGARGKAAEFLGMIRADFRWSPPPRRPRREFTESLGEKALALRNEAVNAARFIIDAIYWSFIAPLQGRGVRMKALVAELREMGWNAIGIVSLINFLLGVVIAMLSAAQLRMFGIQILVASAVVIGFARELAVVMTGIVVSARTGAAIAAELGTMVVSEEIDALRGMGLSIGKFLIAPKVIAILLAMPILTAIGFVTGVAGGFFVGVYSLDFAASRWWEQTVQAVIPTDLLQGMIKSVVFAIVIVVVGCQAGLSVRGGARGVGLATTRAVVLDIFFIIVVDMIFASIFFYIS